MIAIDLHGEVFGRLTVIRRAPNVGRATMWRCKCSCGKRTTAATGHLRAGHTISCGCYRDEIRSENATRHGGYYAPEYKVWSSMKGRCYRKSTPSYAYYGARGVRVCKRWRESYEAFYEDMGPRPSPTHHIDRIDTNGHYAPGNCRWATPKENQRNRANVHLLTHNGKTQCISAWSEELGFERGVVLRRICKLGWTVDEALSTPSRSRVRDGIIEPVGYARAASSNSSWKRTYRLVRAG